MANQLLASYLTDELADAQRRAAHYANLYSEARANGGTLITNGVTFTAEYFHTLLNIVRGDIVGLSVELTAARAA